MKIDISKWWNSLQDGGAVGHYSWQAEYSPILLVRPEDIFSLLEDFCKEQNLDSFNKEQEFFADKFCELKLKISHMCTAFLNETGKKATDVFLTSEEENILNKTGPSGLGYQLYCAKELSNTRLAFKRLLGLNTHWDSDKLRVTAVE